VLELILPRCTVSTLPCRVAGVNELYADHVFATVVNELHYKLSLSGQQQLVPKSSTQSQTEHVGLRVNEQAVTADKMNIHCMCRRTMSGGKQRRRL